MKNPIDALKWRYAVQKFDSTKKLSEEEVNTILEAGRLAPSAFGFEPWKLILVKNEDVRKRLQEVGYGQPKIVDASHLIVVAVRTDMHETGVQDLIDRTMKAQDKTEEDLAPLRASLEQAVSGEPADVQNWATKQTFIPLGTMIEAASVMGIDNAPMSGFQADGVDEVLGLKEKNLHAVTMLALGHRGEDPAADRAKVRRDWDDAIEVIK